MPKRLSAEEVAKFHNDLITQKPFKGVAEKHIGSIRARDLLSLPPEAQELFMRDPEAFFKRYNKLKG